MLDSSFAIVGALLQITGRVSYVIDTLRGQTQPNRATWSLWTLAPAIAFTAEIGQHVGLQSLLTLVTGIGALMVFLSSFMDRRAYWKLTKIDWTCGALSLLAIILWQVTRIGDIAIAFSILADGLAGVPTLVKAYYHPQSESALAFLCSTIAASLTLLTIKDWTLGNYGFPLYILAMCGALYVLTQFPHLRPAHLRAGVNSTDSL